MSGAEGLLSALGMQVTSASEHEVVIEWQVADCHRQPMGIVHGGVHCSAIETACSIGASIVASQRAPGTAAVGLENHTSFVRAVREGWLKAVATPVTRGRTTQVWQAVVTDDTGKVAARGTVRLLNVAADLAT